MDPETPAIAHPELSPSREHTADEWESYRERFTQLYMVEDKALPDVRRVMESRHDFHAT